MAIVIGLTGGIASGKSTVSRMLLELGLVIIDADVIARKVVEEGQEAYNAIVQTFGEGIVLPDRSINRAMLGSLIFHDDKKRLQLNQIVHPAVRKEMIREKEQHISNGEKAVILDIPLLFESRLTSLVDKTVLIYVDEDVQLERLMQRNNLNKEEAEARIHSQMPLSEKVSLADFVINNNGTPEETKQQVIKLCHKWGLL